MDKKNAPDDFSIEEILKEARTLRERQAAENPQMDLPVEEWNGPARAQALPVDGSARPPAKKKKKHSHPAQQKRAQAEGQKQGDGRGIKEPRRAQPPRREPDRPPRVEEPDRPARGDQRLLETAEIRSLLGTPPAPEPEPAREEKPALEESARETTDIHAPLNAPAPEAGREEKQAGKKALLETAEIRSLLGTPPAPEPEPAREEKPALEESARETTDIHALLNAPAPEAEKGEKAAGETENRQPGGAEPKRSPPILQTADLDSLLLPPDGAGRPEAEWQARDEDFAEPEEDAPKRTWRERREEKKRARQERRRLKRAAKGLEEEDDIYYGLQLKPLNEYKKQYEQAMDMGTGDGENPAAPRATFSYLFDSSDEEVDDEIAARFADLHRERRQRVAQVLRDSGGEPDDIFHLYGTATNTIELKFPNRGQPAEPEPEEEETAQHLVPVENQNRTQEFAGAASPEEGETAEFPSGTPAPIVRATAGGETFEFPSVGELNHSRRTVAIEQIEQGTFEMPAAAELDETAPAQPAPPRPAGEPAREPVREEPGRPAPMAEPTAPAQPAAPVEMPQPAAVPVEAPQPMRAEDGRAVQEDGPRPRAPLSPQDYRPTGVTPVHVIELHNYEEVILREAKTYPKPAPLHIPVRTAEIPARELARDILREDTREIELPVEPPSSEPPLAPAMGNPPPDPLPLRPPLSVVQEDEEGQKEREAKKEKKFSIVGEEEPDNDPQENLPEEEPEEIDDYQSPADAPSVQHELGSSLRELSLRLTVTGILALLMLGVGFLGEKTSLLPELLQLPLPTQTYLILNLVFLCIAAMFSWVTMWNGVKALFHLQANSDSGAALATLAAIGQSVALLFQTKSVAGEELHTYAVLACLALFLNTAGKFSLVKRISRNFRFVASPDGKYAVELFDDHNTALQMAKGVVDDTPVIAYQQKTGFLRFFLKHSYENDPSDQSSQIIAPIGLILSLVLCGACYFITKDVMGAITAFTAAMCMCVPMANMLCVNLPLARLTRIATRCGAMVVGYAAVEKFSEVNAMVLDAKDLFPKGTVILNGIKTFAGQRIDDAIMDATALMYATGGPLSDLFDQIIKSRSEMLPKIENITYEDGKGVTGWVAGRRVLIGNRELMLSHGIEPPSRDYEEKYLVGDKQIVYFASGGDLVAMFVVSYHSDRRRAMELRRMEDNGIGLIVRTCDPNITPRFLSQVFSIGEHSIRVLPQSLGNEYSNLVKKPRERGDAYLATKGRPTAVMRMLAACVRQRGNISIAVVMQNVAVVLGFLLAAFLSCYSGLAQLSTSALLLFELFWVAAILFVPRLRKP